MKLPEDGYEPERISPVIIGVVFIGIIVVLVLWVNKETLMKKPAGQQTIADTIVKVEQETSNQGNSTLSPEDFEKLPSWREVKDWPGKIIAVCGNNSGTYSGRSGNGWEAYQDYQ